LRIRGWLTIPLLLVLIVGFICAVLLRHFACAERIEITGDETPWRAFLVNAAALRAVRATPEHGSGKRLVDRLLPPPDWVARDFDAGLWTRHRGEIFGGYGYGQSDNHVLLCLRTVFQVSEPEAVRASQLTVKYRGGVLIYLNGKEIARGHMPEGVIDYLTAAESYRSDAYLTPEGDALLPRADRPASQHLDRYERRVRALNVTLSRNAIVKGINVLAIEIHRSADVEFPETQVGEFGDEIEWNPLGFYGAGLTFRARQGALAISVPEGMCAWNADSMEPVTEDSFRSSDPPEPLRPMRLVAPRNGVCSGQVVLGGLVGLDEVVVNVGELNAEGPASIRDEALKVRYAVREEGPYCDTLVEEAPEGQGVVPVWLIVDVPADQEPGRYAGQMTIRAGPAEIEVPVELQVCAWTLPDPKDYVSHVSLLHSPDTLALKYGVEPWSDRHFELIGKSLALMGQVGNDVIYIPVVRYTHLGNNNGMIRWIETADGHVANLSVLERFLDLYEKHCGPPKVLCLEVWNHRIRDAEQPIVTRYDPGDRVMSELAAPLYGTEDSEAFWTPMMDGVRESVRKRGWDERCIMVGAAGDRWPRKSIVEFFRQIAPYARWSIFTHGRWRGTRKNDDDGRFTIANGMEIGYYVNPWGYGDSRLVGDTRYKPWDKPYVKAGSMRECIATWSHPVRYRNLADISVNRGNQGFGRVGLDYWSVGGQTLLCLHERKGWERLYKGNPRSVVVAGPDGAVPTVRFQLLREGIQEAEARIAVAGLLDLRRTSQAQDKDLVRRGHDLLERRQAVRRDAKDSPHTQLSADWNALTAELYELAHEMSGLVCQQQNETK